MKGAWLARRASDPALDGVVASGIEHHAVLHTCQYLEKREGYSVTYVPVDGDCLVNPEEVREAIRSDTSLVSIMAAA